MSGCPVGSASRGKGLGPTASRPFPRERVSFAFLSLPEWLHVGLLNVDAAHLLVFPRHADSGEEIFRRAVEAKTDTGIQL